ncbi:MAG: HAD-IA family hydrolase [Calothrix sp. MO_167.B42]|nr:HAD-IA family hydrolase [Calothrix sp. MO_167.B42]
MLSTILFDLDGTIVNTNPIHYQAWREMLKNHGMDIDKKFYQTRISGRTNPEIIQDLLPQFSGASGEKIADEKEELFRQKAKKLQPLPGFSELIAWIQKHQLKCGLVTNAPRLNAHFIVEMLDIKDIFDTIILADDCIAGKPDPIPYQKALQELNVKGESAIALEDSPSGIRSAVAASISTVAIASTHNPQTLKENGAFMVVPDFTDLQLWMHLKSLHPEDALDSCIN